MSNTLTEHEVAVLLAKLFNDKCACNYNNLDEWLPYYCEKLDICPNPGGVECWEQLVKNRHILAWRAEQ